MKQKDFGIDSLKNTNINNFYYVCIAERYLNFSQTHYIFLLIYGYKHINLRRKKTCICFEVKNRYYLLLTKYLFPIFQNI